MRQFKRPQAAKWGDRARTSTEMRRAGRDEKNDMRLEGVQREFKNPQ